MIDAGEHVFDERKRVRVWVCAVFLRPGECHRCGLLTADALCALCRAELGLPAAALPHDVLIA